MTAVKVVFLLTLASTMVAAAVPDYKHDSSWQPAFPKSIHLYSAVAVSGDEVFVSQRGNYSQPILVLNRAGELLRAFGSDAIGLVPGGDGFGHTWGGHGLAVQHADPQAGRDEDRIWVMDCVKGAVHSFAPNGTHLKSAGRLGYGASEFGCVADAAFHGGNAYFADGDAINDNRVEAWAAASGVPEHPLWTSEPAGTHTSGKGLNHLSWPHSVTWHEGLGKLLVADRGAAGSPTHSRIVVMDPATGRMEQTLNCEGLSTPNGYPAPFAVRTLRTKDEDLLFVAVADVNPQDGNTKNQWIYIVDVSKLAVDGTCKTLQRLNYVDGNAPMESVCETPHLLGIDYKTYDVYMACVDRAKQKDDASRVVRITRTNTTEEAAPSAKVGPVMV